MEHHEGNLRSNTSQHQAGGAYPYTNQPALICPNSPETQTAAFRSQRITSPAAFGAAPPLLQPTQPSLTKLPAVSNKSVMPQDDSLPLSMAQKKEAVGAIPVFPSFHILERTAIQINEDTLTVSNLLDRIFQYLRLHSISYECEADTGCFECTSPNMIGFVVQLWRGRMEDNSNNNNTTSEEGKKIWVEVQRRQGCAIAMNAIRRSLLRHIKGDDAEPSAAPTAGRRRPYNEAEEQADLQSTGSNKRQRSISPNSARLNCLDALALTLRLLESSLRDQQKLGLESLSVLTDSRLVSSEDATTAARALLFGEGPAGPHLQQRLGAFLREVHPTLGRSGFGQDSYRGYTLGVFYHIILHALANALEQVYRDATAPRVDLNSSFWQPVTACLMASVQDAIRKPHEATLSAKCLRFLLPSKTTANDQMHVPTMQTALQKTHTLGRAYNLSLEEESRKTLSFL